MTEIWSKQNKVCFQKKSKSGLILPQNINNCGIGGCVNDGLDCDVGGNGSGGGASVDGNGVVVMVLWW